MGNSYSYLHKTCTNKGEVLCDIFSFKSEDNLTYIVEVDHYDYDVLVVKFYLKAHRQSEKRYNFTLQNLGIIKEGGKNGSGRVLRILNTLLNISLDYYQKNSLYSFAFIGAPRLNELETHQSEDQITWRDTIRYRVYKNFVLNKYSPDKFNHIIIESASFYLLQNKNNTSLTKEVIDKEFRRYVIG